MDKKPLKGTTRISLARAAEILGYRSTSTLRQAAIDGDLPAEHISPKLWVTTEDDVRDWDEQRRQMPVPARRGKPRPTHSVEGAQR